MKRCTYCGKDSGESLVNCWSCGARFKTDVPLTCSTKAMKRARYLIIIIGILLPYLARIPGAILKGSSWFTSYLGDGSLKGALRVFLFLGFFNALCWGGILAATFSYRHPRSVWFPALLGFVLPALGNACLDLSADPQAALALVFIPIFSIPLVVIGWLIGLWYDRKLTRQGSPT